jgi:uncharacterized protein
MSQTTRVQRAFRPVSFTNVTINDTFWSPRLTVNRERTLATEYDQLKQTGRIDAFRLQWKPGMQPVPHIFWDSDTAKWIEAASYSLATHPDPDLDALLDEVIALIVSAQQPDGYLNSHFIQVDPEMKFRDLRDAHELYCAGHLIEAGVAHYQATGKRSLLDAVCRYADHIGQVFGRGEGQKHGYSGHEEIELALVKLSRATGEQRYMDLAHYFVEERGQQPNYFDLETQLLKKYGQEHHAAQYFTTRFGNPFDYRYNQSHVPVREQTEVGGHAVRAMYLYSAVADLAGETGDPTLLSTCERLWENLCLKRMYVTGGIGDSRANEGFTGDYVLPNETAYAETCAAVGLVFWNHRMLQLTGDSRYADVVERALYNGVISGISLDGRKFFYENPLASSGNHHRQDWFDCACCPPNLARLLASLGEYIYSTGDDDIAVHLYAGGRASFPFHGQQMQITQQTRYPWDDSIIFRLDLQRPDHFGLRLRVPGWCKFYTLAVNDQPVDPGPLDKGYLRIARTWQNEDTVELTLAMPVERVHAHPAVKADIGRVAIQRGPVVYCLEGTDHPVPLDQTCLPADAVFNPEFHPDLLDGVTILRTTARSIPSEAWQSALYQSDTPTGAPVQLTAIPYYAWDNRAPGEMLVWIRSC